MPGYCAFSSRVADGCFAAQSASLHKPFWDDPTDVGGGGQKKVIIIICKYLHV